MNEWKQDESSVSEATNETPEQVNDLAQETQDASEALESNAQSLPNNATDKLKKAGEVLQAYVKENPLKAVGLAVSLGLLLGAKAKKNGEAKKSPAVIADEPAETNTTTPSV